MPANAASEASAASSAANAPEECPAGTGAGWPQRARPWPRLPSSGAKRSWRRTRRYGAGCAPPGTRRSAGGRRRSTLTRRYARVDDEDRQALALVDRAHRSAVSARGIKHGHRLSVTPCTREALATRHHAHGNPASHAHSFSMPKAQRTAAGCRDLVSVVAGWCRWRSLRPCRSWRIG